MVFPRWLARFNRRVTNPLAARLTPKHGPLATVVHVGRRSGTEYRTPVTVFVDDGTYRIALTYGRDADWVRNVEAAGGFWLEHNRSLIYLEDPSIVDASQVVVGVPNVVQAALRAIGADCFLVASE